MKNYVGATEEIHMEKHWTVKQKVNNDLWVEVLWD